MFNKKAFTLVELAITLIIIGIVVAAIIGGNKIIESSRLAKARMLTSESVVKNIEGLVAWYETSLSDSFELSEAADNSQITKWHDLNPSSIVMHHNTLSKTASSAVTYIKNGINSIPAVKFGGSNSDTSGKISLSNFYQGNSSRSTIFMVLKPTKILSGQNNIFIDSGNPNSDSTLGISSSSNLNANFGATANISVTFAEEQTYALAFYSLGSDSKVFFNNSATPFNNTSFNSGTNQLSGLTIGANKNGAMPFNGLISEIIIFNRPLQNEERKAIFRYLADKYRLKLS